MLDTLSSLFSGLTFRWADVIDILLVGYILYLVIIFIRETRAVQLVKGLLLLVVVTYLSELFHLHTLNYILKGVLTLGAVALIIVFQPELRRALERIGRGKLFGGKGRGENSAIESSLGAIVRSAQYFAKNRIGALIVFERETALSDIIETGVGIDAHITEELLGTIFYVGTPLHDGAVVIRGLKIEAAGCVLPLTGDITLNKELGTRHRAAIGLSEISDALILVVSEETGTISIAMNGKITRKLSPKTVEKTLRELYFEPLKKDEGAVRTVIQKVSDRISAGRNGKNGADEGVDAEELKEVEELKKK
jgi:diadenylate cyclase